MTTLHDVAENAQVSVATVSRIITGRPEGIRVSEKTRTRVLEVIERLNYQPNLMARSLKSEKSHTLGIIVVDFKDEYITEILSAIEQVSIGRGYYPLFSSVENNQYNNMDSMEIFMQNQVAGLLLVGSTLEIQEGFVEKLQSARIKGVAIAKRLDPPLPYIGTNNVRGGFLAVEHLIQRGHRKIGLIMGAPENQESQERLEGCRKAFREYGLAFQEDWVVTTSGTFSSAQRGYQAAHAMLLGKDIPTALFAWDDRIALGAIRAIGEKGLRVPDDLALVGYDDVSLAEFCNPALSTIRQPMSEMGRQGASLLIDLLEGKVAAGEVPEVILEPTLVVRRSSG